MEEEHVTPGDMFPRQRSLERGQGAPWGSSLLLTLPYLELNHFLRGETQVHAVAALELKGAFVELGDGLVHVQHGILLCHLPDDLWAAAASQGWQPLLRVTEQPGPSA